MDILKNISSEQFFSIFFFGCGFCMLHDILLSIINYINEKAWLVNDYEKMIVKYLNLNDVDNNKERKLISNAREKISKSERLKGKFKMIFRKKDR